jgi:hypothetical protein
LMLVRSTGEAGNSTLKHIHLILKVLFVELIESSHLAGIDVTVRGGRRPAQCRQFGNRLDLLNSNIE